MDDFGVWEFDFGMGACTLIALSEFGLDSSQLFFFGSSDAKGADSIFLIGAGC